MPQSKEINIQEKTHQDVYKTFFLEHQIVLSWHNCINRWSGIAESFNNFKIKQKVSTKTYCGIKLNKSGKITFKYIYEYDGLENRFITKKFDQYVPERERVMSHIENYLHFNFQKQIGAEISFICENPRGHGFGTIDVMSLLIISSIQYIAWTLDMALLQNHAQFKDSDLFQALYHDAWTLADIINQWRSTWDAVYTCMSQESLPIVYISKNVWEDPEYETDTDKVKTYKANIADFLWLPQQNILPIDFGVLHFGVEYDEEYIYQLWENYKNSINTLQTYIMNKLKHNSIGDKKFYFGRFNYEEFYDNFIEVGTILHLKLIRSFENIIKNKYNEQMVEEFINNINEFWAFSTIVEFNNTFAADIRKKFHEFKMLDIEKIGLCPLTVGKMGGTFLFVTPYKKSRRTINKIIEHYNFNGKKLHLEYCSRSDGYTSNGLVVEQDLTKKVFSRHIETGSVIYKDNLWKTYIWAYNTLLEQEKEGILLDKIANKMYINGKAITSKELVSQTSTIDILEALLDAPWVPVHSKQLSSSSYTKQKNQMVGKILLPLKELSKSVFGKDLAIECSWWLYDFYLTLKEKKIKIGIIKEI